MDETKTPSSPQDDDPALKQKWDDWLRDEIAQVREDRQSSTDSFDRSMLTLSSAALGVSIAFVKDVVPLGQASWISLLVSSWLAFGLCIVITVLSFLASTRALRQHEENLRRAHRERMDPREKDDRLLKYCTWGAILFFLVGLACTMIFLGKNVYAYHASEGKIPEKQAEVRNVRNYFMSEQTDSGMKTGWVQEGRKPMQSMPTPASKPAAPAQAPSNTGNTGSTPCPTNGEK